MGGREFGSSGREVDRWAVWRGTLEETGRGEYGRGRNEVAAGVKKSSSAEERRRLRGLSTSAMVVVAVSLIGGVVTERVRHVRGDTFAIMAKTQKKTGKGRLDKYYKLAK